MQIGISSLQILSLRISFTFSELLNLDCRNAFVSCIVCEATIFIHIFYFTSILTFLLNGCIDTLKYLKVAEVKSDHPMIHLEE